MPHPETRVYNGDSRRLEQLVPLKPGVIEGEDARKVFEQRDLLVVEKVNDSFPSGLYIITRNNGTSLACDPSNWDMVDKSSAEHLADESERITGKAPITVIWR